jgi:hypothetical protein
MGVWLPDPDFRKQPTSKKISGVFEKLPKDNTFIEKKILNLLFLRFWSS